MTSRTASEILATVAERHGMSVPTLIACRFVPPRADAARTLIAAGASRAEVALLFGCTTQCVAYWMQGRAAKRHKPRAMSPLQRDNLRTGLEQTRANVRAMLGRARARRTAEADATGSGSHESPANVRRS